MSAANRNVLWAEIFVDELARSGLKHVCIAPGSRSTPLAIAFAQHPDIHVYSHLDERSMAFFALGMGLATGKPAAILCTSGTATANFYPAIVEAYQSEVPLLVITADRSAEVRDSGANQTIDQVKMYGDSVLWLVDVGLPESNPPALVIRSLRTLACRAFMTTHNLRKGPVHINMPFRKPLEPIPVPTDITAIEEDALGRADGQPFTQFFENALQPSTQQIEILAQIIGKYERGWILCGPRCDDPDLPEAVIKLAEVSGYPIIADPLSNVRYGPHGQAVIVASYDTLPLDTELPDVILRFGNVPTSTAMLNLLTRIAPPYYINIKHSGKWSDDAHLLTHFIQAKESLVCKAVVQKLKPRPETTWLAHFQIRENAVWDVLRPELIQSDYFDGVVLADIVELLPENSALFIGNSLPVRHLDQFGFPTEKRIAVYGNRGASGIDGIVSTALGVAAAKPEQLLTLVIGDISFYHDMNGLLAIARCGVPITIVLLNNDGGGIFHRLPIKDFDPPFTDLFITAHGLNYEHAAKLYGLEYTRADDQEAFRQVFSTHPSNARLIEVRTDAKTDLQKREAVMKAVSSQVSVIRES